MPALRYFAVASLLAAPMLLASAPAEAATARQQALQGQGIYTTSKGLPEGYRGGYVPQPRSYGYQSGRREQGHLRYRRYDGY